MFTEQTPLKSAAFKDQRVHYVDVSSASNHASIQGGDDNNEDPIIRQLPKAMFKYIQSPEQHQAKVTFVERGFLSWLVHCILSLLCSLLCCYSCCRMVVVRKGEIALTQNGDSPELLPQGRHVLLSPFNTLVAIKNLKETVIIHNTIHIIKVQSGQLGFAVDMQSGHPILLTQGEHIIDSPTFQWQRFITLREPQTVLGNLTIIRVETGNVGYCYKQGQLVILKPGLHLIQPPDRFGRILTTQMTILDLPLCTHETSDYVPLAIKAAVFYRIMDPLKALVRIQNIPKQIQETATATLAGIIRASSLSDVASRSTPFYHRKQKSQLARIRGTREEKQEQAQEVLSASTGDAEEEEEENKEVLAMPMSSFDDEDRNPAYARASAPPFFQHVHDEFMTQLHDHLLEESGIEIQNIRIEQLSIADEKLQTSISAQAINVSNTHNQYMLLTKQQQIVTVQAETEAQRMRISTDAEARQIRTRARAKAEAIVIEAEATKKAKQLQGEGESEYSRLLQSAGPLGQHLASMKLQADAIGGLKQVAYVPHLPSIFNAGVFATKELLLPDMDDREAENKNDN